MPGPSYYFTLFKKLQVINHAHEGTDHGASPPAGNYNLTGPNTAIGASNRGNVLGSTTNPADSPLYMILRSRAMGNAPFTPVSVGGTNWPTMPTTLLPAWNDFQVSPPTNKLVDVLGTWIMGTPPIMPGKINDTPRDVIARMPPPITRGMDAGVSLFVCSVAGDTGIRPGTVPPEFWNSSLVFLVDPMTGNTVTPSQLSSSAEYHLTAVIGNRGNTDGGRYLNPPGVRIESAAWVMVWNTSTSPAVQLPALSNLDPTSTNGIYEVYVLKAGQYDIVGFRLNVQTVFDGLVRAISESGIDLGLTPPEIWLHGESAHLCARVLVRQGTEPWPTTADTPFTNRRVAQKNLVPFAIDLAASTPDPNIIWRNFMMGDTFRFMAEASRFDKSWGQHHLVIRTKLPAKTANIYLAIPHKSFDRWVSAQSIKGFKKVADGKLTVPPPFKDYVVLALVSEDNVLPIPVLGDEYLAMSLGIEYSAKKLKAGTLGDISLSQSTALPKVDEKKQCYKIEHVTVGGFTIRLEAYDSRQILKPKA